MASYDMDALIKAIVDNGKDQYFQFGKQLGLKDPQIRVAVGQILDEGGKILAVIGTKKAAVGDALLQQELIKACKNLSRPIWADVERDLNGKFQSLLQRQISSYSVICNPFGPSVDATIVVYSVRWFFYRHN